MRNTQTDFVESLKAAARENPLAAGLIRGGALWLLIGNDRLKGAFSSAAVAASATVDLSTRNLRAAGLRFETASAPPTVPEMDPEGQSRIKDTLRQARSAASDAISGAADTASGVADTITDRFDEGMAYARENFSKMDKPLPGRDATRQRNRPTPDREKLALSRNRFHRKESILSFRDQPLKPNRKKTSRLAAPAPQRRGHFLKCVRPDRN
jgi:hypothetical protein